MSGPAEMIVIAAFQLGTAGALRRLAGGFPASAFWGVVALVIPLAIAYDALRGSWWGAAGEVIAWLAALAMWWLSRRNRKDRARRWLGAKSRALRDALVRKARELAQPRPVLVPGGAR